ncbi:MAG: MmcQ/YjbR family DNA-binding protein [Clostridia bacterium]|nr:MmcQ/YjbR family DNA-binding protein [Clostridia bacterium]
MNRLELEDLIRSSFGVVADYPFEEDFTTGVFRHKDNKKWFAIAMRIPKKRLGLDGDEVVDIVNLKCGEELCSSLWQEPGFFPAYHMNKTHWVSVLLNGEAEDDAVIFALNVSFELTSKKKRQKQNP